MIDAPTVEIEEPAAPLAGEFEIEEPLEELLDEEVPLADVPYTGGLSIFWIVLSVLSAAGLVTVGAKRKH